MVPLPTTQSSLNGSCALVPPCFECTLQPVTQHILQVRPLALTTHCGNTFSDGMLSLKIKVLAECPSSVLT